ncbi:DUF3048 domain-containing protein [Paenibacillus algorifonticola]|uniref:DUF3048 domain-containing protein n=1 Tax=Paenibacillus algorifonticola TaxID=684063 RepID=UPI003D2864C6
MKLGKRIGLTSSILLLLVLLAACGGGSKGEAVPSTSPEPSALPSPSVSPGSLPYQAPLTGVGRQTEALERPIAVMINNLKPARPQSGLSNADVVWEVLAEGGITRLVALFQSTDAITDSIGPIRSIRPYLINIGESYGAVLAHAGGSNDAYAILQQQKKPYLDEISNAGAYFWRSKERKAPHNLYSDLEKLRSGAEKKNYKQDTAVPAYVFAENGAAEATTPATAVTIHFTLKDYKVSYAYDEASKLYKRSINDEAHIDLNNNEQLAASNLVVLAASHKTLDNEGRLAVDLQAGGDAMLFQQGRMTEASWVRAPDNMIRIVKDGKELALVPGKTFFHIVPNTKSIADHVMYG